MTEPRDVSYLVPADVLAEVNTAVTVLETYGPAVTEALRQLDRATTVAWKAVNLLRYWVLKRPKRAMAGCLVWS
jgi:hypothetical protein